MKIHFKTLSIISILILTFGIDKASFAQSEKVPYAVLKDSTLTFNYGTSTPQKAYDVEKMVDRFFDSSTKEWYSEREQIKIVVFDKSFKDYRPKSCNSWFEGCDNLTSIKGIKENLNTSEVTDMGCMFENCENLTSLDVSGFNTENVTNMESMFEGCEKLTSLDVSGFNTENVTIWRLCLRGVKT